MRNTFLNIYFSVVRSGVSAETDQFDSRRIVLVNQIAMVFILLSSGYFFVFHQLGFSAPSLLVIPSTLSYAVCIFLNKIKRYSLAALSIIASNCLILFYYASALGKPAGAQYVYFSLVLFPLMFFKRKEYGYIVIGFALPIATTLYIEWINFSAFENLNLTHFQSQLIAILAIITTFCITIASTAFYHFSRMIAEEKLIKSNRSLNKHLNLSKKMIKKLRSQQAMEADLAKGKKFQDSTLPQAPPLVEGLVFSHAFEPAKELSGDYFDYFLDMTTAIAPTPPIANTPIHPSNDTSTDTNDENINWDDLNEDEEENPSSSPTIPVRRIGVVVADVVGKGVSASLEMFSVKTMLKLAKDHWFTPKALVTHLNELSTTGAKVFERHVPLIYLTAETHPDRSCTIRYVNAGHEYGIILRHNNPTPLILDQGGSPVGMDATETYTETQLTLHPGDVAFLFTDGCTDVKTPEGQVIGSEGFIDILKESTTQDPKDIAKYIRNRLKDLQSTAPQADDMTIVAVWVG